ncbi:MAG: glycoside hydrolase family 97 protein [Bacteroidales bacterium]|nr:glycoside hydrolase family 97 protein [Bacteroidales bacterium]
MKRTLVIIAAALFCTVCMAAPKSFTVSSPDGHLSATVQTGSALTYSVTFDGAVIVAPSEISMTLTDGTIYGGNATPGRCRRVSVSQTIKPVLYKRAEVKDEYNEMKIEFKAFDLLFRAYDEGVAYRFVSKSKSDFCVAAEKASFCFAEDYSAFIPYVAQHLETLESQLWNSFENTYEHIAISAWDSKRLAFLPLVVEAPKKVLITEADLWDYPGMYLYNSDADATLEGVFAAVPDEVEQGGHNMLQGLVKTRKPYIAECKAGAAFPWRVIAVASNDIALADCDLVYKLARPAAAGSDWSWMEPGKVAWDWWNDWNITGVDFAAGINNDTYKYYIDFASANGIEYVILDEGWAVNKQADLFQVIPEIDVKMLSEYAQKKNVGLVLWAGYWAFNRDMEAVCKHYSQLGIKGFKIDFMDRDDQPMVHFYQEAAATAAKYHMFVDFHGAYKPTGLHRTFPNVINYEGVHGLEQMKWEKTLGQVEYDVTIPFIRMAAGPMDYTQGAMLNATMRNYRPCNSEPMSIGTRCRQLAEYVIFDAPFTMLCDSPSHYMKEPECTEFIASIPTVWDETMALDGVISDYVVMARRSGSDWYVGALTDEYARTLSISLDFLEPGTYEATVYADGVNASRAATDFRLSRSVLTVSESSPLTLSAALAPAGGYVIKLHKR